MRVTTSTANWTPPSGMNDYVHTSKSNDIAPYVSNKKFKAMDDNKFNKALSLKKDIEKYEKIKDFIASGYSINEMLNCLAEKDPSMFKAGIYMIKEYFIDQCDQRLLELKKEFKNL